MFICLKNTSITKKVIKISRCKTQGIHLVTYTQHRVSLRMINFRKKLHKKHDKNELDCK
jgi:hypothetical protein